MSISKDKLKWRSRRSMLELDLYFDQFIQNMGLDRLTENELFAYRELLDFDDGDLLLLFQGKELLDNRLQQNVIDKIRDYSKLV